MPNVHTGYPVTVVTPDPSGQNVNPVPGHTASPVAALVPPGGTTGQFLAKTNDLNYQTEWVNGVLNETVNTYADIVMSGPKREIMVLEDETNGGAISFYKWTGSALLYLVVQDVI